ncbi:UPF0587 protein C2D10.03c [Golovinomyces cichoracearum]|uniref:UPF0587 protein C2D10.03c n=1 Tax=Golovinomyces cichoracearum TaxID=62708 RepID=A0A420HB55_9PEZI|nr:UPF0587 protein C2D10.03c [Golovinomyces cichoracearum]
MLSLFLTADLTGYYLSHPLQKNVASNSGLVRVTNLRPHDTVENPFWYTFSVQCSSCRQVHPKKLNISRFESNAIKGSRGDANLIWKCKSCKREASATIIAPPTAYQQESPATRQKIIEIDCRGLDIIEFSPEGEWLANGSHSKTQFSSIDLTDGEWYEYDETLGEEVNILDLKWEITKN